MAIFLDGEAAGRRGGHDRLGAARRHQRQPGIDVAAHVVEASMVVAEMRAHGAAAAGTAGIHGLNAGCIEHARRSDVDIGHHRRLDAASEHQHLAAMLERRSARCALSRTPRHLIPEHGRQERPHRAAHPQRRRKQRRRESLPEQPAHRPLRRRALHPRIHDLSADIHQMPVLDAARTRGLAIQTGQAAIQMSLRAARDFPALEHLLHQIYSSTRPIELIAQQLIRRAGRVAEPAMHAFADDGLRLFAVLGVREFGTQMRLHGSVTARRTYARG